MSVRFLHPFLQPNCFCMDFTYFCIINILNSAINWHLGVDFIQFLLLSTGTMMIMGYNSSLLQIFDYLLFIFVILYFLSNRLDPSKVKHTTYNTAFKNHPRDITHYKNHLYEITLVHLTSNTYSIKI